MSNIIFGELGGYMANRAMDNQEFRLDTPEPETIAVKSHTTSVLAGLGRRVQGFYQHLFNSSARKRVEEGKVQL